MMMMMMMMMTMMMMMMMIAGHPHHRREREAETETLRPSRILVAAQLDRLEGDDVEDEDAEHDEGGEVLPAEVPEDVRLVPGHLLNAVTEPLCAKEPPDSNCLKESDPEECEPRA